MLCIFAGIPTRRDAQGNITRKGKDAGEHRRNVQALNHVLEDNPSIQQRKEGRFRLTFEDVEVDEQNNPVSPSKRGVLQRNPDLRELFPTHIIKRQIGEAMEPGIRDVFISPSLPGLTIDDFPENFAFGIGTTANSNPPLWPKKYFPNVAEVEVIPEGGPIDGKNLVLYDLAREKVDAIARGEGSMPILRPDGKVYEEKLTLKSVRHILTWIVFPQGTILTPAQLEALRQSIEMPA